MIGFALSGCSWSQIRDYFITDAKTSTDDRAMLSTAQTEFQSGNYNKAQKLFEHLRDSENNLIGRQALYGLACTNLVLAENTSQFNAAIELWTAWSKRLPHGIRLEDPRMLEPLLPGKIRPEQTRSDAGQNDRFSLILLRAKEKEIESLKNRLIDKENKIAKLSRQTAEIADLQQQIQLLQHQIKTFEAIDQKIQEKKKEFTTP